MLGATFFLDQNRASAAECAILGPREHLDGAVELGVAAGRVARIERDFDRRRDADPFKALTIDQNVLDRE
jgi:hypothetical protein